MISNPAKRATSGRKGKTFTLRTLQAMGDRAIGIRAQISGAGLSASSTERVLANTPSLRKLYEFLEKDKA